MRRTILVTGATAIAAVILTWVLQAFDARSAGFAFFVVWVPMAWLGIVSRFIRPRLASAYHELRKFERDGRLYEHLGVVWAKRLLRRGPLAVFNPDLHLPVDRTPEELAHLDRRMRDAEASHLILLVATLGVVAHAVARGWWGAAGWTLLFDVLLNGYPVMLQRYNRARLGKRYSALEDDRADSIRRCRRRDCRRRQGQVRLMAHRHWPS
jgi:Glycosyl-4,4'-diaponeurosporenoate acyltransferase